MFLAKHGLVTWGATGQQSYARTISVLQRAEEFLSRRVDPGQVFGGLILSSDDKDRRRALAVSALPMLRGALSRSSGCKFILTFDDSPEVLEFVNSRNVRDLAGTGAACPDHVMYTKFLPLMVDRPATGGWDPAGLEEAIGVALESYESSYQSFFQENSDGDSEIVDPSPRVVLIPGLGMVAAGKDKWSASNTAALYRTAIRVMRGAELMGGFTSLSPKEAWDVEFWPLELYKLTLRPPDRDMAGRIALITGGAGAIGSATALRLLDDDAHVVITDLDGDGATRTAAQLSAHHPDRVIGFQADAGCEADTERVLEDCILQFGGLDLAVPNAGIAGAHPIDETTVEEWRRVQDVLLLGYFLTCRAAFSLFKRQGLGGVIVINSSKNGLAAGKNAIAYTTAKAAETHMCRCLAEEGGPFGIRVNSVAPDAIIKGSGFWTQEWREERSRTYGFAVDDIEEYYRQRNALKVNVEARDVAETILWLASDRSAKTTGCVVTIDGGLMATYPR
jgi:rhamnulose-1-phosphate aldolase/alcohol dehydrogenase